MRGPPSSSLVLGAGLQMTAGRERASRRTRCRYSSPFAGGPEPLVSSASHSLIGNASRCKTRSSSSSSALYSNCGIGTCQRATARRHERIGRPAPILYTSFSESTLEKSRGSAANI
eukprot:scaffold32697_cov33-Tisochrysis_lutea.AAC.5